MIITIKRAELVKHPNKDMFSVLYKGKRHILLSTNWDDAEKEAKLLLKQIYPKETIIIG